MGLLLPGLQDTCRDLSLTSHTHGEAPLPSLPYYNRWKQVILSATLQGGTTQRQDSLGSLWVCDPRKGGWLSKGVFLARKGRQGLMSALGQELEGEGSGENGERG